MSNNAGAIAPWLGYSAQEYRLVSRLLKAPKSHILGFEILDDVHEYSQEQQTLEQDKVSITTRNIVSNQSKDLWKTLFNWIDLIKTGKIDATKTKFLLYTNKPHSSDALTLLCNASTHEEAQLACNELQNLVLEPSESIKRYVDNFFECDDRKLLLITNFEYAHGSGSAPQDLKDVYLSINTSISEHSENIMHEILGWTKDTLTLLAENRETTLISADAFGKRLGEIESKYRQKTLLNYICNRANDDDDVQLELTEQPVYIQQLNLLDIDNLEIEDAVIAKLEAKDAVTKWTLEGHIQEASYGKYNGALKSKWKTQKNITFLDKASESDEHKGAMLYYQCLQNGSSIELENKKVEEFFAHGSLHELSDSLEIGWHPNYKTELKGNDDT